AAGAAPGRADPAGRPAGGHLLLDRLRFGGAGADRLRCGRLAGRRGGRGGWSGRGMVSLIGAGRRGPPTASGGGFHGSVGVGFSLVRCASTGSITGPSPASASAVAAVAGLRLRPRPPRRRRLFFAGVAAAPSA